ncbi:hypothetical protein [Sphingopyxis sp. DBS4]|uniref:hypothetical protein n=1 Tax=Sphingopyxis sp. DBS4 TaxID=2968500 RepID=UPI00214A962E|nr:hypothetical protein [Sphingopyxis sp. DBS4]
MHAPTNRPDPLVAIRQAHQFRAILDVLEEYRTGNDQTFYRWLANLGLAISRRDLAELFDRLDNAGLTSSTRVESIRVISLTSDGSEVARGIVRLDWIAAPELG